MRDLAIDPPLAIRAIGVGGAFGPPGLTRPRPGAFGRMLRGILGFTVSPMRTASVTAGAVLKDLSFEIEEGSAVCIAGASGATKSALLRLLAGVVPPATGRIEMRGPVAGILEIGGNIEPGKTALQNIETHRRLLRIPAAEAGAFAAQAVAFAELGGFEQVPVRKYSTGMQMRLSLALALQGSPSIVLLDDVLGVGDAAFRRKCIDRLLELKAAGCALVIVPGDEGLVQQLATRVMTLGDGRILADGPPARAMPQSPGDGSAKVGWQVAPRLPQGEAVALEALELAERREEGQTFVDLFLDCDIRLWPQRCRPLIHIMNGRLAVLRSLYPSYLAVDGPRLLRFSVAIPIDLLPRGQYKIDVAIVSEQQSVVYSLKARAAVVLDVRRGSPLADGGASTPLVSPVLPWEIETIAEGGS